MSRTTLLTVVGVVAALLAAPERWPDVAAEGGRFTALRGGGLAGQTFEIEVVAGAALRAPAYLRAYVTATQVIAAGDAGLDPFLAELEDGLRAPPVPPGARVALAVELTTHAGHFLGRGRSRLLLFDDAEGAWLRAVGSWDPLPVHLRVPFALAGRAAQHLFWSPEPPGRPGVSMLAQAALVTGSARP